MSDPCVRCGKTSTEKFSTVHPVCVNIDACDARVELLGVRSAVLLVVEQMSWAPSCPDTNMVQTWERELRAAVKARGSDA